MAVARASGAYVSALNAYMPLVRCCRRPPSPRSQRRIPIPSSVQPESNIMVLLVTSDNEQFVVDKEVAERSVLIKNMLEGWGDGVCHGLFTL